MMFRHLLVPLDGSHLAEAVLPVAAAVSRALQARITLQHVVEPAEAYLRRVADRFAAEGVAASIQVDQGAEDADVAVAIARHAAESGADLIVLCTHGRGGVRRMLFGRVAEQVLARGETPVLLMAPTAAQRDRAFHVRRMLVSLDGSEMSEAALPAATELARGFGAELLAVMVVPTVATLTGDRAPAARLMPTAGAALLDVEAAQAADYLNGVRGRLEREGVTATTAVERGEPVRVLLDRLARPDVDLMVMATHGRSGVSAVWAGSVASRVVAHAPRPLLLIRVPREG